MARTCQNKVSADQHHLNISRAEAYCLLRVGFLVDRWPGACFRSDRGLKPGLLAVFMARCLEVDKLRIEISLEYHYVFV